MIHFKTFITLYVFSIQLPVALCGNILLLIVLMQNRMRAHLSNRLISAMCVSDIAFLLCMAIINLYRPILSHWLDEDTMYYDFNMYIRPHAVGMANWFSPLSSWLLLVISCDRLYAVSRPIAYRRLWTPGRLLFVKIVIVIGTFMLSFWQHVCTKWAWSPKKLANQSTTTMTPESLGAETVDYLCSNLSSALHLVFIIMAIVLPVFAVLIVNVQLLKAIKKRWGADNCQPTNSPSPQRFTQETEMRNITAHFSIQDERNSTCLVRGHSDINVMSSAQRRQQRERKVSATVFVIAASFVMTHLPSALLAALLLFEPGLSQIKWFLYLQWVSNSLVVTGKAANFLIFCSTSTQFRQEITRLFRLCKDAYL